MGDARARNSGGMDPLEERIGTQARTLLARARVGIAGAGGLGSNIAMMLARSGVGHLVIVDFDLVDESNLNRQHYFCADIGRPKVEVISEQIDNVGAKTMVTTIRDKVTEENVVALFTGCSIVCEAFDDPEAKAMLVDRLMSVPDGPVVICGNGMAGTGPASEIVTTRAGKRLYICGDGKSDVGAGEVLFAPRVVLCAAHQALLALRIVLGLES